MTTISMSLVPRCYDRERVQNILNGSLRLQAHGKLVRRERVQTVLYRSRRRMGNQDESFQKPPEPVCYRKKIVPTRDREWITIPAFDACNKNSISSAISKMVTRMVRHHDQDDRDHDGAAHWHTIYPKLLRAFEEQVGRVRTEMGFITFISRTTRQGSNAKIPDEDWCTFERSRDTLEV